jgi:hypothetical protein
LIDFDYHAMSDNSSALQVGYQASEDPDRFGIESCSFLSRSDWVTTSDPFYAVQ